MLDLRSNIERQAIELQLINNNIIHVPGMEQMLLLLKVMQQEDKRRRFENPTQQ